MQSVELYRQARYDEAEISARKELACDKTNHDALQVLGNVCFIRGDFFAALSLYRRGFLLGTDKADVFNIANVFFQLKKYRQAALWVKKALTMDDAFFDAWILLGQCQMALEQNMEATDSLRKACRLKSDDVWVHSYLGQVLQKNGEYDAALEEALCAVLLSGGEDSQQINMAYALYETALENGKDSIQKFASAWQQKYAGNPIVDYALAALVSDKKILKSDALYVRKIFDIFAEDFEETLASLDYRVPQIIATECKAFCEEKILQEWRILDMGCGTGLCGKFLASLYLKISLDGVDISAEMLKKAAEKNVYKSLFCDDVEHFFAMSDSLYDVIVAADVLTYFGALENIFFQVKKHLKKNGAFIFSVTQNSLNDDDSFLHMSGRFLHTENYVKKVVKQCGFMVKKQQSCKLREEGDSEVFGWIFCIEKSS